MVVKWFKPGRHTGWDKTDSAATRRRKVLKSRRGNALKAGRALQALANVTTDSQTKKLAAQDARYFFKLNAER